MIRQPRTLTPSEEMRLLIGVLVQPLLAGAVAFFLFPVLLLDQNGQTLAGGFANDITAAARSVAIVAGVMAFLVTLLGALPTAVWLMKRKQVSLGQALLAGLGFGNIPFLLGTLLAGTYGAAGFARGVVFSSLLGVTCAAGFWSIAVRPREPDDNAVPG